MRFKPGRDRFAQLFNSRQVVSNPGVVTVTAALASVVDLASVNVIADSWLFVQARISMSKGITAGRTQYVIRKSVGTAEVRYMDLVMNPGVSQEPAFDLPSQTASLVLQTTIWALFRVTVPGTVQMGLHALSAGSNGSVAIGFASLEQILFK